MEREEFAVRMMLSSLYAGAVFGVVYRPSLGTGAAFAVVAIVVAIWATSKSKCPPST